MVAYYHKDYKTPMTSRTKKATSKKRSNDRLKQSRKLSLKLALPVIALTAIAGMYLVFTSYAGKATYARTGKLDWRYSGTSKAVKSVVSKDGKLCVAAKMNTYNTFGSAFGQGYYFHVDGVENGKWVRIRSSQKFQINGNRDHQCFDAGINKGYSYRVSFDPIDRTYMHGQYFVWGYNHN